MEAEGKKHCLKCLLREMDKDAYFQNLHDYIAGLDEDIKADGELYEDRLAVCKQCDMLQEGMCRACGCFVELRAVIRVNGCPYDNGKSERRYGGFQKGALAAAAEKEIREISMLYIKSLEEGLEVFKALGSEIRIEIIKILLENQDMNMNELAARLKITNGALTSHIKKLEDCGIITVTSESAGHGNQKKCEVALDKILIDVNNRETEKNMYDTDLKVGHYSAYEVCPTCGMATSTALIGAVDDTRYFAHPDRYNADILWFTRGYVEYIIPNFIPSGSKIDQISISLELGSEAPGVNDVWPSDISFYLNGVLLGKWTSPGDFGDVKGIFTPDWWPPKWNQYGMLKLLVVNSKGAFIDGLKISDMDIRQLHLDYKSTLRLRFAVDEDSEHVGGLTIFGKSFGNYNQDINVKIAYSPMEDGN